MKKFIILILAISLTVVAFGQKPIIPEASNKYVVDDANILSSEEVQILAQNLKQFEMLNHTQIVIYITNNLSKEYPIEDYCQEVFTKWGIGHKGVNNGVLIFWAPNNRKTRIHVGYGLEEILTDAYTKRIQSQITNPNFKAGKYFQGLNLLLAEMLPKITPVAIERANELKKQNDKKSAEALSNFFDWVMYIFGGGAIIGLLAFVIYKQKQKEKLALEAKQEEEMRKAEIIRQAELAEQRKQNNIKTQIKSVKDIVITTKYAFAKMMDENFLNSSEIFSQIIEIENNLQTYVDKKSYDDVESICKNFKNQIQTKTGPIIKKWDQKQLIFDTEKSFNDFIKMVPLEVFQRTLQSMEDITNKHGKAIWKVGQKMAFNPDTYQETRNGLIDSIKKNIENSKEHISNNNFDLAEKINSETITLLHSLADLDTEVVNKPKQIQVASDYIAVKLKNINADVLEVTRLMNNSVIPKESKDIYQNFINSIDFTSFQNSNSKMNILERRSALADVMSKLNDYKINAGKLIQAEADRLAAIEKKRLSDIAVAKKREQDRLDAIALAEAESSRKSCNDDNNNYVSQNNNDTDYGGGDSGGGGSSDNY